MHNSSHPLNKSSFLTAFLFFSLSTAVAFAEEKFPFLAEVSSPHVNIRAGQHSNFEKLCRLNKGAEVIVVDRSYSWYKIKLPTEAKSFISQNYVQLINEKTGSVAANRVNVRAGPDSNTTALGQVKKGTTVNILEKLPGWYRIDPVEETYGWVSDQYLKFKSNSLPAPRSDLKTSENLSFPNALVGNPGEAIIGPPTKTFGGDNFGISSSQLQTASPPVASPVPPSDVTAKVSPVMAAPVSEIQEKVVTEKVLMPSSTNAFFVSGKVAVLEDPKVSGEIHHKLIIDDQTAYYLEGTKKIVDEFISYQVMVEGRMKEDPQHLYLYPVIVISRINLVL